MFSLANLALLVSLLMNPDPTTDAATVDSLRTPMVVGHRGASGYRPEHTASAYRLAIRMGADMVEPDVVVTSDGVLVSRHDEELSGTTDVASRPEFRDRHTTRTINNKAHVGWFVQDFTLAELKTLRAKERRPELRPNSARFDGTEPILTIQELIDLVREESDAVGRTVGLLIELKDPAYHASIGLPMERPLVDLLNRNGLNTRASPVVLQCFEPEALVLLRTLTPLRLNFLVGNKAPSEQALTTLGVEHWQEVFTPSGLTRVKRIADALGPEMSLVLPRDDRGNLLPATTLVRDAHAAGLGLFVWTLSAENKSLPVEHRIGNPGDPGYDRALGNAETLARALFSLGIDGLISDHPDVVVAAREK